MRELHALLKAKGVVMAFLTLEDRQGTLAAVPFPDVYRVAKPLLGLNTTQLMTGFIEMDAGRGEPYLLVESVTLVKNIRNRHSGILNR